MKLFQKILYPIFFSLHLCPLQLIGQEISKAPETIEALQIAIENVLKETETPAAGIALVDGNSTVWVAGLGKANISDDTDATENTMFRIGSTTKMYVSLAILKLQEEGRLSLKDKVRDLIPEIEFKNPWSETAPILVEHLLEHTTGWDDIHLTEYALNKPNLSLKEGLDYHPHSRTSRWMPGTRMSYCNSGPPVAAYIVEKITGQTFEDYIREQFFQPMGMEHMTYFSSDKYKQLGAVLYIDKVPQNYWNIIMRPSGSINASPKDMAKMLQFFIHRGRTDSLQLISEESMQRMETPSSSSGSKAGLEYGYGLSNYSSPYKSFVFRSHNGGVNGGLTDFSYLPDHKVGYAIMINSGNGNALYRISELVRFFLTKDLKVYNIPRDKVAPNRENDISGYYITINPRTQMSHHIGRLVNVRHIWNRNDFIFKKNLFGGRAETFLAINDHQYVTEETGKISMVQLNDPIAGGVVHAGTEVLMKVSPILVFGQLIIGIIWILALIGSSLLGIIWLIILYRKRGYLGGDDLNIRLWPFIASLFFLTIFIMEFIGASNPFDLLGKISFVSVSIMILTICFALASVWAIFIIIKKRNAKIDKKIYWYSAVLSGLHFLVTCYLLWYGVIGIQTWG